MSNASGQLSAHNRSNRALVGRVARAAIALAIALASGSATGLVWAAEAAGVGAASAGVASAGAGSASGVDGVNSAGDLNGIVRATIRADKPIIPAGRSVWIDFTLTNQTANRLTLRIPDVSTEPGEVSEMGLPIEHVFSGKGFTGPKLEDDLGERRDSKNEVRPKNKVPAIRLAPFGSVGVRLDLAKYYPSITRPGKYKLTWQPYNGSISSEPLEITVLAEREAVVLTDLGKMVIRFHYDEAPQHVQNFIELLEKRFYDNLTFNRVIPGGLIQGGDPLGNRRGLRADGKRLKAEFNDIPFELGTVGMARSSNDPDSASCQFFICLGRQPAFDGKQTAFGYLVGDESFATLRRIAAVPTGVNNGMADYPKKPVYIRAISLETVPDRQRRIEPPPITPATNRPAVELFGRQGGSEVTGATGSTGAGSGEKSAADLPGLRAQGSLGHAPATEPTTAPTTAPAAVGESKP